MLVLTAGVLAIALYGGNYDRAYQLLELCLSPGTFLVYCFPGSSVVVQIFNALLENVLPPATQDPALNFIGVKRVTDALGVQQVGTREYFRPQAFDEYSRSVHLVGGLSDSTSQALHMLALVETVVVNALTTYKHLKVSRALEGHSTQNPGERGRSPKALVFRYTSQKLAFHHSCPLRSTQPIPWFGDTLTNGDTAYLEPAHLSQ